MKKIVIVLLCVLPIYGCFHSYETERDAAGRKVLMGPITRTDLESDNEFQWFNENYTAYHPDTSVVSILREMSSNVHCILFLGTWCSDSKNEVPKMFKVFDSIGIPEKNIMVVGIDHDKKSIDDMPQKYSLKKVPTLIVFRGEKEIGRIVELPTQTVEIDLIGILQN